MLFTKHFYGESGNKRIIFYSIKLFLDNTIYRQSLGTLESLARKMNKLVYYGYKYLSYKVSCCYKAYRYYASFP